MIGERPRLGFLGTGWIGRLRLEALAASGVAEVAAVADADAAVARAAADAVGCRLALRSLDDLLSVGVDGVVIATPSALHAAHATAALDEGAAVFCQKPLARTAAEAGEVVAAARAADRLLGVDLSYRFMAGVPQMRELILGGQLGEVFAAHLTFHNAYGPDKAWFFDRARSGGGCLIDLGIHLVDLALWTQGFPPVRAVSGRLFAGGRRLAEDDDRVEDFAVASIGTDGSEISVACSWHLHAGRDAVIEATFHGTRGGVALRNVGGSFFDFRVERHDARTTAVMAEPPDDWGGRALVDWAGRLARGTGYDPECARQVDVAEVLDRVYEAGRCAS